MAPTARRERTLGMARLTDWARHVADARGLPLATVLAWPISILTAEIARAIVDLARSQAQRLGSTDPPGTPPDGDDLLSVATRAVYARIRAAQEAAEESEQAAAWDELERGM